MLDLFIDDSICRWCLYRHTLINNRTVCALGNNPDTCTKFEFKEMNKED